jgi:hypothetical protein
VSQPETIIPCSSHIQSHIGTTGGISFVEHSYIMSAKFQSNGSVLSDEDLSYFISDLSGSLHYYCTEANRILDSIYTMINELHAGFIQNLYSIITLAFRISKINHKLPNSAIIYDCAIAFELIIIVVRFLLIHFLYSVWKSIYTANATYTWIELIRYLKRGLGLWWCLYWDVKKWNKRLYRQIGHFPFDVSCW